MVEYSSKVDWKINVDVKNELVKRGVDIQKLRISSTRGVVEISGELVFVGKYVDETAPVVVTNLLRAIDRSLKSIYNVRDVVWKLNNWKKTGNRWIREETKI